MSRYKKEMMELVVDLMEMANQANFADDPDASAKFERRRRQAETLEFVINHPEFLTKDDND